MRKLLTYTVRKAIQVSAIIILPVIMFDNLMTGGFAHTVLAWIDFALIYTYWKELRERALEKELHGELL
jgi:hypothetical protein